MKKILSNYGISTFLVLLAAFVFRETRKFSKYYNGSPGSGFWPRVIAGMLIILAAALIIENMMNDHSNQRGNQASNNETMSLIYKNTKRVYMMFIVMVLSCISMKYCGFIITSLWFICAVMFIMDEKRLPLLLCTSTCITAAVYLIFTYILALMLPRAIFM